ncbi:DUF3667 domain-containing protein [Algibacter sp. PT7-4]|uniref:DUF3667 domain-containing protein n=1 Tax=Algibacter ulvanivorans TaxID=3400999 RepID=UPI003AB05A02
MVCRNCNKAATPQNIFCSYCGEKIIFNRLTVKSFILSFINDFLSIDNKLINTFISLFTNPEKVINGYINGFRKIYVNAIPYLGLTLTLIGLQFFILKQFYPELLNISLVKETQDGRFSLETLMKYIYDYQGLITIISIPLYALISRFVFIDSKKYNTAEHFVIVSYASAQLYFVSFFIVIVSLPFGVNYNNLSTYLSIPMLFYMVYLYKRLYSITVISSFFRGLSYSILSILAVTIFSAAVTVIYLIISYF